MSAGAERALHLICTRAWAVVAEHDAAQAEIDSWTTSSRPASAPDLIAFRDRLAEFISCRGRTALMLHYHT